MRILFEKFQQFIADKIPSVSGHSRAVAVGSLGAVSLVAVLAVALVVLRLGEAEQIASDETNDEAASEISRGDDSGDLPDDVLAATEPDDSEVAEPSKGAGLGGFVPTTSNPPPEPEPEPAPAPAVEPTPTPAGGPSADAWAKLRDCEASGRYDAVNPAGYYGAYQFNQGTWDSVAKSAGRNDLAGVNPAKASPADQDAMALALYASRGAQPWPTCGRFL